MAPYVAGNRMTPERAITFHPSPSRPHLRLPSRACEARCHVFGPASTFPITEAGEPAHSRVVHSGAKPQAGSPAGLAALVKSETAKWGKLIANKKIKGG